MSSLSSLVDDLPVRIKRVRRVRIEDEAPESSEQARAAWLEELDREAEIRGDILPNVRAARRLSGDDLERAILADLIYELNRKVKRENGADDQMAVGWGHGAGKNGDAEKMPAITAVTGPAPATNLGLKATLRSYLDAREPCDRYDSLIRHAATALLLAEQIAQGRA